MNREELTELQEARANHVPQSMSPPSLTSPTSPTPRLDGDDLYVWAQMESEIGHLLETKQRLAIELMTKRGFTPGEYLLNAQGYILSRAQIDEAERRARIQSFGQGQAQPPPRSPGSDPASGARPPESLA